MRADAVGAMSMPGAGGCFYFQKEIANTAVRAEPSRSAEAGAQSTQHIIINIVRHVHAHVAVPEENASHATALHKP
eukprot:5612003-Prymnesium_polylepis.1